MALSSRESNGMALAHCPSTMFVHRHMYRSCTVGGRGGFTLVEVMIVCVIVAIISMMAVPAYLRWYDRYQLRMAVNEVTSNLNLARTVALSRNTTVNVQLAMVGGKVNLNTGVFPPIVFHESIKNFSGGTVSFNQLGIGNAQTLTLTSREGATYSVIVSPNGKVNWCAKMTCP
jgi:prepilin-type N-terminal cleavage/methylation domain-containing protein